MRMRFDRGTLVLEPEDHDEVDVGAIAGTAWDAELAAWRVPADALAVLRTELTARGVALTDLAAPATLAGEWRVPTLRWYQQAALSRWMSSDRRGVVALPTGAGKTAVALSAIATLQTATLCLVPTRVLLDQWVRTLSACWSHPIGRLGDGDHAVGPITVATYASAVTWAPRIGDRFGLIVVDEAHHVGAWCPADLFEMLTAPARLGLTATPPTDAAGALARHIGPVVYSLAIGDLVGDALAEVDIITVPIELDRDERRRYRELRGRFATTYRTFQRSTPSASWSEFVRSASRTTDGREAVLAWREYRSLLAYPAGKRAALRELLQRHAGARVLVFTADNATAYAIARELLVMPITHEIGKAERARAIAGFRSGELPVLVSSQVLDEGFDVPDAEIAIVVGGTASARRHVQRIGRVLRPGVGKRARVYELAVEETTEVDYVQRRRASLGALVERRAAGGAR